jgi:hypothetical protein
MKIIAETILLKATHSGHEEGSILSLQNDGIHPEEHITA